MSPELTTPKQDLGPERLEIVGARAVANAAEAVVRTGIAQAFGAKRGVLYIQPYVPGGERSRPDLLLCTEKTGLLVVSVKGHDIQNIGRVANGAIFVRYDSHDDPVIATAERHACKIGDAVGRALGRRVHADWVLAFPNITRVDWNDRGLSRSIPASAILFAEDLADSAMLRERLTARAKPDSLTHPSKRIADSDLDGVRRAFGDSAVLVEERPVRTNLRADSLGARLDEIAGAERTLSEEQRRLSLRRLDGRPLIVHGVAGSGKSVVLANMLARAVLDEARERSSRLFQTQLPRYGAVCFNRTLAPFLTHKIKTALKAFSAPVSVVSAGASTAIHMNGLCFRLSRQSKGAFPYFSTQTKSPGGRNSLKDPNEVGEVEASCRAAKYLAAWRRLPEATKASLRFDALFIDEAQDLLEDEIRLCRELIRLDPATGQPNLIIFYDDAQNLYARPRPNWADLGIEARGARSQVMRRCYRNPRPIIELAFNVLLGAEAPEGQRVETRRFADVRELRDRGLVEEADGRWIVRFTERSEGTEPEVEAHPDRESECRSTAAHVVRLIQSEGVRPSDILIIAPTTETVFKMTRSIRRMRSLQRCTMPHLPSEKDQYIFRDGQVTVTTPHSAKGYDAPVALVVGADEYDGSPASRAAFYVACSRARELLIVSGLRGVGLTGEAVAVSAAASPAQQGAR